MNNRGTICILGGSGFVGSELCASLCNKGYGIKLLTRNAASCRHLRVLPTLSVIQIKDYSAENIATFLKGSTALINLIGILNEKGRDGTEFHQAHVEVTRAALVACEQTIVRRLIQISALHANPNGPSHYLRSKGKAENYLNAFSKPLINTTIFKPSVIFGRKDSFMNRFAALLKWMPGVFPLACANARFAPVYVGDVVEKIVQAIDDETTFGKRYDLVGPKEYTLKELVQYCGKISGHPRWVISLPNFLSKIQARMLEFFPGKPLSMDNYRSLQIDSTSEHGVHCRTSLESIAPTYLGRRSSINFDHRQSAYT